jgi:hypothetical protein
MAPFGPAPPAHCRKEKTLCASIKLDTTYSAGPLVAAFAFLAQFALSECGSVLY